MSDATRLWRLARSVAREPRTADIWPQLHLQAIDATGASRSVLLRVNPRSGELFAASAIGLDDLARDPWFTSNAARAAAERAWSEGVPLVFTDVPELTERLGTLATMLVPVTTRKERLGILALAIEEVEKADAAHAQAGAVGELIAITLDRARLERDIDLHQDVRALVMEFTRAVSSSLHLDASLEIFCNRAQRLFATDRVSVWLFNRRARMIDLVASSDIAEVARGQRVSSEDATNQIALVMRGDRAAIAPGDVSGGSTTVLVPLRGRRRALGTLVIEGVHIDTGDEFGVLDRVEEVGRQLSVAVENVWLLEDVLRSRRELENTVNALAELVLVVDRDLRITHANQACADRLGRRSEEILDRPLTEFFDAALGAWLKELAEREGGPRLESRELNDARLGGSFVFTASPLVGRDEERIGMVIVARDATEQARHEAERAELRDRLTQSEKLAALGQFVAGIAHELNNPLQGVLGHVELMLHSSHQLAPRLKRDLKLVFREADRAAKIVHNLLVFAGSRRITRRRLNLNLVVSRALKLRATASAAAGVEVDRHLAQKLPRVAGDALLLQQALLNIIVNAEQALATMGGPRRIEVRTERRGPVAVVQVADNGPGIPLDALPRLFEPFFTTKEVGKGTGLGLAIAYGIVQEHGGKLHAANRPEGGAVFTLELPLGVVGVE